MFNKPTGFSRTFCGTGSPTNTFGTPGGFGASTPQADGGMFGQANDTSTTGGGQSAFGQQQSAGFATNTFGTPGGFGASTPQADGGMFGQANDTSTTGGGQSAFGQQQSAGFATNTFGTPGGFGASTPQADGGMFGQANDTSTTGGGQSAFGQQQSAGFESEKKPCSDARHEETVGPSPSSKTPNTSGGDMNKASDSDFHSNDYKIKCTVRQTGKSLKKDISVDEDGEEILESKTLEKRQRVDRTNISLGDLLPDGNLTPSDISFLIRGDCDIEVRMKYCPKNNVLN